MGRQLTGAQKLFQHVIYWLINKLMAKTQGFYKVVRASAVTHRKLQISKVVTPPIPD
jgi:hypothetical protein